MILSYRGSHYEIPEKISTQLPKKEDYLTAKYRGFSYKIPKYITTNKSTHQTKLHYRGVTYISSGQ